MKHALIIEDNPLIVLMLQDHLEVCGYDTVDVATSQAQAISLPRSGAPIS